MYLRKVHEWFPQLEAALPDEISRRLAKAEAGGEEDPTQRGAVWTYVTTDQPFGRWTERFYEVSREKLEAN
jgi:hypothetical protein